MDMKIEKWQVESGIAEPANPHERLLPIKSGNSIWTKNKEWKAFDKSAQQHACATDAPNGIHSAEMFGEVVWQYKSQRCDTWYDIPNEWVATHSPIEKYLTLWYDQTRSFLPFKHPIEPNDKQHPPDFLDFCSIMETGKVQPNDKQPMEGEYGYGVVDNMLGCALVNEVGELNNVDFNPNANAIKIVSDRIKDLEYKRNLLSPKAYATFEKIEIQIKEAKLILTLI